MQLVMFVAVVVSAQNSNSQSKSEPKFCLPNLKGWLFENPNTQRCYEFVTAKDDRLSWSEARDYCQLNGGRLVNIEDQNKQVICGC